MDRDLLFTVACDQASKDYDWGCDILSCAYFNQEDSKRFVTAIFRAIENQDGKKLLYVMTEMMETLIDIPRVAAIVERDHNEYLDYLDGKYMEKD